MTPSPAGSSASATRAGRKRCSAPGCRRLAAPGRKRCADHKPGGKRRPPTRKITGRIEPRLFTKPLRPLNRKTSLGFEIIDFAEMIGEPLLPWQKWLVIHAFELLPSGAFRFRTVLVLVARQNGKSHLKRVVSLWRMYMDGATRIIGVAQDVALARDQWNLCQETIHSSPDLEEEWVGVRNVNGDEWFKAAACRYAIKAANRKAGRGGSNDEVNIDELREQRDWDAWAAVSKTTMARPRGQVWAMSNAGDDQSVVLNQLRETALAHRDPSLFIAEWSGKDGCELDDWDQIAQANPGLGHTVSMEAIRSALGTDPPAIFRTEVLCQKVDALEGAIDSAGWKDCKDAAGTMDGLRDRLAACFDMAPDGQHATLTVAALLADGRPRVEVVKAWTTSEAARAELPALRALIKWRAFGWYPTGPAAALAPLFRSWPEAQELTGMRVAEVCQGLADLVRGRGMVHSDDPLLNAHIIGANRLPSGDGWRFTRRGGQEQGHVDAAYAAAGAVNLAQILPPPKRARIRRIS